MTQVVITVIGADRAGLVDRLSGAVRECGGNWERSHLAELAGRFAGVVTASLPAGNIGRLSAALDEIESEGLLHIALERSVDTSRAEQDRPNHFALKLIGQDHHGIVHEISHALAQMNVSIDELQSAVVPAPMGGNLFEARAILQVPGSISADDLADRLESISPDLMIDIDAAPGGDG